MEDAGGVESNGVRGDRSRKPRVALLGFGHWGRNLGRVLAAENALCAIADPSPDRLHEAARAHPTVAATLDWQGVLADATIDACVIAAPAGRHFELARSAMAAGKDVLVEKPLALTAAEGEQLVEIAGRHDRILMVGHVLEYHPGIEQLRELVRAGELGRVRYAYSNRLNHGRIRTEESALWSFAPHDVHVLLSLLGEEPVEVSCQGGGYLDHKVADVTMSTMRFASGVRGHIFVSWLHPFHEQKLVVVGERSMAVFDDLQPHGGKLRLFPHRVDWIERVPVAVKAESHTIEIAEAEPLAVECRHFLDCVATRRTPRTGGANGVAVLRVLEACQRSMDRGGIPIELRPAPRFFAHPTATLDAGCEIGEGTHVWHYSHVMPGARIGRRCTLGQNVFVARDVVIGDDVKIQNGVSVFEGVELEDEVFCGPAVVFTNVTTPRSGVPRKNEYRPTRVRHGATIGANATIVCGHTIGRYAFVGAGAVVTHDVMDHALVVGVPATVVGWACQCGARLQERGGTLDCRECGRRYVRDGAGIAPAAAESVGREAAD